MFGVVSFHFGSVLGTGVGIDHCRYWVFFLMIRRPPSSTQSRSSAASDVYKRQVRICSFVCHRKILRFRIGHAHGLHRFADGRVQRLSLIHISEPTRLLSISYAVFCLKKKNYQHTAPFYPAAYTPPGIYPFRPHVSTY